MNKIEEFARTKGYKYLLPYADEDQIMVEKKYTFFRSRKGIPLKIKNSDIVAFHYLHSYKDVKLTQYFKKQNPQWLWWLLGK